MQIGEHKPEKSKFVRPGNPTQDPEITVLKSLDL